MSLFNDTDMFITGKPGKICYDLTDGDVTLYENYFTKEQSDEYYNSLMTNIKWEQNNITVYNKEHLVPRLTAWYGDDKPYTYSNVENRPHAWSKDLLAIKSSIESEAGVNFTNVLLNLYRGGQDSVGWHRDNEKEFGVQPVIASVTFGQTRVFQLRHKYRKDLSRIDIPLNHGSMLLMKGDTQHSWEHQVPKTTRAISPRINLTFRVIKI